MLLFLGSELISNSGGAPAGRAGSPIDIGTCNASTCHTGFPLNSGTGTVSISADIPAAGYTAGNTYKVTVAIKQTGMRAAGFQAIAHSAGATSSVGTASIGMGDNSQILPGTRQYLTHTNSTALDSAKWTYNWTAPSLATVTFYSAINGANGNGNVSGDRIYTTQATYNQATNTSIEKPEDRRFNAFYQAAGRQIGVSAQVAPHSPLTLRVFDAAGRSVLQLEDDAPQPQYHTQLDASGWKPGLYMLQLAANGSVTTQKILVY